MVNLGAGGVMAMVSWTSGGKLFLLASWPVLTSAQIEFPIIEYEVPSPYFTTTSTTGTGVTDTYPDGE